MIEAIDLSKKYEDGHLALSHLNLLVRPGEIYCLLGANGAGKTTTINLFFNFIQPTGGTPLINGFDCTKNPLEAKRQAAYVSENVMLYGNFTALQNLEFFGKLSGRHEVKEEEYVMIMHQIGLSERVLAQRVKTFSRGMRQKLGIAIALVKQARALFLDEPTSGLDPRAASEFVELLKHLRNEDKAILMSTHDVFRAKEIADRIGIMKRGVLIAEKTREDVQSENLEKLYLRYVED